MAGEATFKNKGLPELIYCPDLWFQRMVLVDGMGRSGKSLVATALSSLEGIEPWQLPAYIDHIVKYLDLGEFTLQGARSALKIALNSHAFDYAVGRGLNRRKWDWSNAMHLTSPSLLRAREENSSYESLLNQFRELGRIPTFVTHENVSFASFWLEAVPTLHLIEVTRHPATLMLSWQRRNLTDRWGKDPLLFVPSMSVKGQHVPIFAHSMKNEWLLMSTEEKLLVSMELQFAGLWQALNSLPSDQVERFRLVQSESLKLHPRTTLLRLSEWLGLKMVEPTYESFITKEGLPRKGLSSEITSAMDELGAVLPSELRPRLRALVEEYEDQYRTYRHLIL